MPDARNPREFEHRFFSPDEDGLLTGSRLVMDAGELRQALAPEGQRGGGDD